MCIIIAKYKNGDLPKKEYLKNSFNYNSDGAGFSYVTDYKHLKRDKKLNYLCKNKNLFKINKQLVLIDKGYMDYNAFIDRFNYLCNLYNDFNNKSLLIHCRITTAGGSTKENAHPYPIIKSDRKGNFNYNIDLSDLHKKTFLTTLSVAHNGIISAYNPAKSERRYKRHTKNY